MELVDRTGLSAAERSALRTELAGHTSLDRVVAWALGHHPPRMIAEVVVQDEYTHDVVIPYAAGRFLVYDTT